MSQIWAIAIGGALGSVARFGVSTGIYALLGRSFPYGTFIVNVVGSFAMGLLAGFFVYRAGVPQHVRLFLTTGILGGFTTFSTFSLDAALMIERHQLGLAAGYLIGSVAAGLAALFFGLAVFRSAGHLP